MAPISLESSIPKPIQRCISKHLKVCSDPLVVPSEKASKRVKELWWLHGHPHSRRYENPKLVSLSALVRWGAEVFGRQKAFLYPISAEVTTPYASMSWLDFDSVTETIALSYAYQLREEIRTANSTKKQPTVGLLGAGENIEYLCTQIALQKLGLRVLLLAMSNASNALHHLLEKCDAAAVIVDARNRRANTRGIRKIQMLETLPESSGTEWKEVDAVKFRDFGDVWERHTFIIHSSGSTGMPKPIIHTNRSMMLIARMYRLFQEFYIENWFLLFPLYHIAGISVALSGFPNGKILSFPPLSWPPSASSIFTAWKTLSAMGYPVDCVHCAPALIENMYEYIVENGHDYRPLASLKLLQPGGAVLADSIIKNLILHGVNVKTTYGSTEIGPPFRSLPHTRSNPKVYSFRNLYPDNPHLKMESVGDGVYECVVYKGFELAADLWEGKPDNEPYRTNDLFIQDPPGSGFYVMQGRKDDILVHTNGENTSAGPLQLDIQTSSQIISRALVVGHSLPCPGVIIELHEKYDANKREVQKSIWQSIQNVNTQYPYHSQISQSMIYILPRGCTLPVTPKYNVRRKEAERMYASEIQILYDDVASHSTIAQQTEEPLSEYLRSLLAQLAGLPISEVTDETSLYDLGIDSHLALSFRRSISAKLKTRISLGAIFENPTISQLSAFLQPRLASQRNPSTKPSTTRMVNRMISKLESEFQRWAPRATVAYPRTKGETVLLTGPTGSLGTALLESLSRSPKVYKIYAMLRGPNHLSRLRSALKAKGIDLSILEEKKVSVLNFSMQDPLLGLDIDSYHHLTSTVTTVIQNAWEMDFNKCVEEFEGDCIRSTVSLLRFCYAGRPKRLAFTSSISTCMGPGHISRHVSEAPIGPDPSIALSTGYAQSKYIIERITQTASLPQGLNIPVKLLRVGQLCGSTKTGKWNTNEMFPIMFATSAHKKVRAIPVMPIFPGKLVDWIPVDVAAEAISEVLFPDLGSTNNDVCGYDVHNIVNPVSIPWPMLVEMIQSSSMVSGDKPLEEVSMTEWVQRLEILADEGADANDIPGLKLLAFWENMAKDKSESKIFETGKTRELSRSLSSLEGFGKEWLEGNLRAWREEGFLTTIDEEPRKMSGSSEL